MSIIAAALHRAEELTRDAFADRERAFALQLGAIASKFNKAGAFQGSDHALTAAKAASDEFKTRAIILIDNLFRAGTAFHPNPIVKRNGLECGSFAIRELDRTSLTITDAFEALQEPQSKKLYDDTFRESSKRQLASALIEIKHRLGVEAAEVAGQAAARSFWSRVRKPAFWITSIFVIAALAAVISAISDWDGAAAQMVKLRDWIAGK